MGDPQADASDGESADTPASGSGVNWDAAVEIDLQRVVEDAIESEAQFTHQVLWVSDDHFRDRMIECGMNRLDQGQLIRSVALVKMSGSSEAKIARETALTIAAKLAVTEAAKARLAAELERRTRLAVSRQVASYAFVPAASTNRRGPERDPCQE